MAINILNLKTVSLRKLKIGQQLLLGPYKRATTPAGKISRLRTLDPSGFGRRQFTQRQMLLVDPATTQSFKMYLITRTK